MNASNVLSLAQRIDQLSADQQAYLLDTLETLAQGAATALTSSPLPTLPPPPRGPKTLPYPSAWAGSFLEAFRMLGNVRSSCLVAGISRQTYYHYLRNCPEFAAKVTDAREDACDVLEAELFNLAVQHHNIKAIMLLLRAYRPDRFSPLRRSEVTVQGGVAVQHDVSERLKTRVHDLFKPLPPPPDTQARLAPPSDYGPASDDAGADVIEGQVVP